MAIWAVNKKLDSGERVKAPHLYQSESESKSDVSSIPVGSWGIQFTVYNTFKVTTAATKIKEKFAFAFTFAQCK